MSVFVGAYVSMWGVWPRQRAALTLTVGFGLGQRGRCCWRWQGMELGTLCRDRVTPPPHLAHPLCGEELLGGSVTSSRSSSMLA